MAIHKRLANFSTFYDGYRRVVKSVVAGVDTGSEDAGISEAVLVVEE